LFENQGGLAMRYEVVFFDADDTLFDYSKAEAYALHHAFREFDVTIEDADYTQSYRQINQQLWEDFEKGTIDMVKLRLERFRKLFDKLDLNLDPGAFSDCYLKYLGQGSFVIEGAVAICNYLLQKGYRLAIITNGFKEVQIGRIGRSEMRDFFEAIIISEETGFQKPHQGIFEHAFLKMNHLDKSKAIMIGDSLSSDIQGGISFGIDTCWFNPTHKANRLQVKPTYEIQALSELMNIL
jgi:2-haloacid dehalogenase